MARSSSLQLFAHVPSLGFRLPSTIPGIKAWSVLSACVQMVVPGKASVFQPTIAP